MNLIPNNTFTVADYDIIKNLQRDLRNTTNKCQQIIDKNDRWK